MRLHCTINNKPDKASATEASATEASANEASANETKKNPRPPPALASAQPSALRSRPPPLPWLAWVASPHHHAPSGREVDGALSRPSPKRNGAPNTCPDYCAFPGCSLSVREGSVRVVIPWNTRTLPRHLRRPVRLRPYHQDREAARAHRLDRKIPVRPERVAPCTAWPRDLHRRR